MMAKLYDNFKILIFVNKINIINNLYMEEVKKMISKKEKVFLEEINSLKLFIFLLNKFYFIIYYIMLSRGEL